MSATIFGRLMLLCGQKDNTGTLWMCLEQNGIDTYEDVLQLSHDDISGLKVTDEPGQAA